MSPNATLESHEICKNTIISTDFVDSDEHQ